MNTEERIVEAAVRLFSEQGFSGTSTRQIARLADVNESSLFRHFPRKQDLFWAAVRRRLDRVRMSKQLRTGMETGADPEVVLPLMIAFLVEIAAYEPKLVRLFHFSVLELRGSAEGVYRQELAPIFETMADYLKCCMERGALRAVDPWIAVLGLTTSILGQEIAQPATHTPTAFSTTTEAIAAYSNFWRLALIPDSGMLPSPRPDSDAVSAEASLS